MPAFDLSHLAYTQTFVFFVVFDYQLKTSSSLSNLQRKDIKLLLNQTPEIKLFNAQPVKNHLLEVNHLKPTLDSFDRYLHCKGQSS